VSKIENDANGNTTTSGAFTVGNYSARAAAPTTTYTSTISSGSGTSTPTITVT
jgi:hypothetical protein